MTIFFMAFAYLFFFRFLCLPSGVLLLEGIAWCRVVFCLCIAVFSHKR
jgi:hypothetical protein